MRGCEAQLCQQAGNIKRGGARKTLHYKMYVRIIVLALWCLLARRAAAQGNDADSRWTWVRTENNVCPCAQTGEAARDGWINNVVSVGLSYNNNYVFLGRVYHFTNIVPALVQWASPATPAVYTFQGNVYSSKTYEVACGDGVMWEVVHRPNATDIPPTAVTVGFFDDGRPIHACRTAFTFGMSIGLIDPDSKFCNFTHSAAVNTDYNTLGQTAFYEVLVQPEPPSTQ